MPVIHDVEGAAGRAKVTEAEILQWVREGLRAMPVGRVGKRGPRDYRIFDSWLVEFLERRSSAAPFPASPGLTRVPRHRGVPGRSDLDDPMGPCPKVKGRA